MLSFDAANVNNLKSPSFQEKETKVWVLIEDNVVSNSSNLLNMAHWGPKMIGNNVSLSLGLLYRGRVEC
jgi:hypothetical protein